MNKIENLELNKIHSRVALYGAGKFGHIALSNFKKYYPDIEIIGFIDDNKIRNNKDIEGLSIYSLDELSYKEKDFDVIITNYYLKQILTRIDNLGFDMKRVFFYGEILVDDREISAEEEKLLNKTYDMLEDAKSKLIFRAMVDSRKTKNIDVFGRLVENIQYFPDDLLTPDEDEVFVDAGAYDGDTIRDFEKYTAGKYKKIYAFEPDSHNYKKLVENTKQKNVICHNAGLWESSKTLCFSGAKGGSSVVEECGGDSISVLSFDEVVDKGDRVTFVKMDIEGSELSALHGMKETIKRDKPKLAICIYHKFEDLWEIPHYIKELVPEYKLYIRNYTSYLDEIVMYALKE